MSTAPRLDLGERQRAVVAPADPLTGASSIARERRARTLIRSAGRTRTELVDEITLVTDACLPANARTLALRQLGCLSSAQLREAGVSRSAITRRRASQRWRFPTSRVVDLGADPPSVLTPQLRVRRAAVIALLAYGPNAIAIGPSALALHGVQGLPATMSPEVTVPGGGPRRDRGGVRCRECVVPETVVSADGFRTVDPVVSLAQTLVQLAPREALGVLDSALHLELLRGESLTQVRRLAHRLRGPSRHRLPELEAVWEMADGRRASQLESWAYWDLVAAGLQPTDIQVEIRDPQRRLVARGDIGFLRRDGTWLLIELQSRQNHSDVDAVIDDGERRDDVMLEEHTVLEFWAIHLGVRGRMVQRVAQHLERRP